MKINFNHEDAEQALDSFEQELKEMLHEASECLTNPVCDGAELRGNLVPDKGDDPYELGWTEPADVDIEQFFNDVKDYAQTHIDEGYKEFSISISCYISGHNDDIGLEERYHDTVDVEVLDTATKYDINSPDGFSISAFNTYRNPEEAWRAFDQWLKRFERQGYYSSNEGRIPLDQVKKHCSLVTINHTEDE